jgi:hypothetical protein
MTPFSVCQEVMLDCDSFFLLQEKVRDSARCDKFSEQHKCGREARAIGLAVTYRGNHKMEQPCWWVYCTETSVSGHAFNKMCARANFVCGARLLCSTRWRGSSPALFFAPTARGVSTSITMSAFHFIPVMQYSNISGCSFEFVHTWLSRGKKVE